MPEERRIRASSVTDRDLALMLSHLDASTPPQEASRRLHRRFNYRVRSCRVKIAQPGSASADCFLVQTRNISAGGLSFLHGAFVHTESRVTVQLITQHGAWHDVTGTVTFCRYVDRGMHEIGVKFDNEVRPYDYCAGAMVFSFLLVEDDDELARLAMHHMKAMKLDVERAENGQVALDMAAETDYDCILMDIQMPIMDGLQATRSLRERGFLGSIVAMTAHSSPGDREAALEAGCDEFMAKPAGRETYERVIEALKREPIESIYQNDASMRPLLADFVKGLPAVVRKLEESFLSEGRPGFDDALKDIEGRAASYGYETIADAAEAIGRAIREEDPAERIERLFQALMSQCMQVRAPRGDGGAGANAA